MNENLIVMLEERKIVTSTFRKLNPAKKAAIYSAIIRSFGVHTYAAVTLDDVADAAGIAKGSLVQYFSEKENFAVFASEILFDSYQAYWEDYSSHSYIARIGDRLYKYILAEIEYWRGHRNEAAFYIKMMYENGAGFAGSFAEGFIDIRREQLTSILERGVSHGEFSREANIKSAVALMSAWQTEFIRKAIYSKVSSESEKTKKAVKECLSIILNGLKHRQ